MHRLQQRISIIGAGIPGLVTAHALHGAGFKHVSVFEAAGSFAAAAPAIHSGGLVIGANGVRILDALGLAAPLYRLGNPLASVAGVTHAGHALGRYSPEVLLHARARHVPPPSERAPPPMLSSVACHGKHVHDALSSALPRAVQVHFNMPLRALDARKEPGADPEGGALQLRFGDSADKFDADLLVADDGLHSEVRAKFMGDECRSEVATLPGVYVRGITPKNALEQLGTPLQLSDELVEAWGTGCKFAYAWQDDTSVYWLATLGSKAARGLQPDEPLAMRDQLASVFASFPAAVKALIAATPAPALGMAPIEELAPASKLHDASGRIVLVGGAAHSACQELWQNVAMGIEDAGVLTALLTRLDRAQALATYSQLRFPRARYIVSAARTECEQAIQGGRIMSAFRDMASSMVPPAVQRETMAQVLAFDAIKEAEGAL